MIAVRTAPTSNSAPTGWLVSMVTSGPPKAERTSMGGAQPLETVLVLLRCPRSVEVAGVSLTLGESCCRKVEGAVAEHLDEAVRRLDQACPGGVLIPPGQEDARRGGGREAAHDFIARPAQSLTLLGPSHPRVSKRASRIESLSRRGRDRASLRMAATVDFPLTGRPETTTKGRAPMAAVVAQS